LHITSIINKINERQEQFPPGHREYAVLVPLLPINDDVQVLFEVRNHYMRQQPGEISFPGGRLEMNESWQNAACRETCEEIGLTDSQLSWLGELDIASVGVHRTVHAGVALLDAQFENLKPSPAEVAELFTVPLQYFLDNAPEMHHVNVNNSPSDNFPFDYIPGGRQYPWNSSNYDVPFYFYQDRVIWGLTARVIQNLVQILRVEA